MDIRNARRMRERGFSLIELGIVIAIIGILATVVLVGRGFIGSSRSSKAVELIRTCHSAINFWASTNGDTTAGINLAVLQADGKLPNPVQLGGKQLWVSAIAQAGANTNQYVITFQCDPDQGRLCNEVCLHEQTNKAIFIASAPAACAVNVGPWNFTYTR